MLVTDIDGRDGKMQTTLPVLKAPEKDKKKLGVTSYVEMRVILRYLQQNGFIRSVPIAFNVGHLIIKLIHCIDVEVEDAWGGRKESEQREIITICLSELLQAGYLHPTATATYIYPCCEGYPNLPSMIKADQSISQAGL